MGRFLPRGGWGLASGLLFFCSACWSSFVPLGPLGGGGTLGEVTFLPRQGSQKCMRAGGRFGGSYVVFPELAQPVVVVFSMVFPAGGHGWEETVASVWLLFALLVGMASFPALQEGLVAGSYKGAVSPRYSPAYWAFVFSFLLLSSRGWIVGGETALCVCVCVLSLLSCSLPLTGLSSVARTRVGWSFAPSTWAEVLWTQRKYQAGASEPQSLRALFRSLSAQARLDVANARVPKDDKKACARDPRTKFRGHRWKPLKCKASFLPRLDTDRMLLLRAKIWIDSTSPHAATKEARARPASLPWGPVRLHAHITSQEQLAEVWKGGKRIASLGSTNLMDKS